jgi:hypothetical protein
LRAEVPIHKLLWIGPSALPFLPAIILGRCPRLVYTALSALAAKQLLDDESYRIRARNNFIAETYHGRHERIAWAADQSLSLARYTPVHTIVPHSKGGLTVNCNDVSHWADPYIKDRINAAKNILKVMLWPFQTHVKYPALQNIHTCRPGDFFCLNVIQNEGEIEKEVIRAFQQAKESKISILIFSELCFTEAIKETAIRELAGHGRFDYPILILFGCCHQREIGKDLDLNIATRIRGAFQLLTNTAILQQA